VIEFLTFLLAPIGYAGLTAAMLVATRGQWPVALARATVAVILTHVFLVWHVRYEWQFSEATRNGYAGFAIFHAALAVIVTSLAVDLRVARRLLGGAFAAVTVGAVGATFKYEVVANYRIPVLLIALTGIAGLGYRVGESLRTRDKTGTH
jgi:hypothetical protein